jgi:hypothetical protein
MSCILQREGEEEERRGEERRRDETRGDETRREGMRCSKHQKTGDWGERHGKDNVQVHIDTRKVKRHGNGVLG